MRRSGLSRTIVRRTLLIIVAALVAGGVSADRPAGDARWSASWGTASKVQSPFDPPPPLLDDVTLRQIVRVSRGGGGVRVWFTNEFGTAPLVVRNAHVALQRAGSAIRPASNRALTFGGRTGISIAPGARALSDPARLHVPDLSNLVISVHLPGGGVAGSPVTYHVRALQTSYIAPGDQAAADDLSGAEVTTAWFHLSGVDVRARRPGIVVAALGDSTTDGDQLVAMEPVDQNDRYTDFLAELLLPRVRAGVVNLGISGNQVTADFIGQNMQARMDRDVFARAGVTHLVVLGGINDIALPVLLGAPEGASADAVIGGLQQIAAQARGLGLKVIGGTITPSGSSGLAAYASEQTQQTRRAVNRWIRSAGVFDAVADFDRALRDPDDHDVLLEKFSADGLHPNSDGYQRMARVAAKALLRAGLAPGARGPAGQSF